MYRATLNDGRNISSGLAFLLGNTCGMWGLKINPRLKDCESKRGNSQSVNFGRTAEKIFVLSPQLPKESTND